MKPQFPARLVVEVTQEDIYEGREGSCYSCPIALAVKRIYPDLYPTVNSVSVVVFDRPPFATSAKRLASWQSSLVLRRFIHRFDKGEAVKPLRLTLRQAT